MSQLESSPLENSTASRISRSLNVRLFTSHFLSTWNSRMFEMGAVLFTAAIFPGTLRPMSVYTLVRSGAAILLSPAIGSWIDTGHRLKVLRISIFGQRLAVAASCVIFWILNEKRAMDYKIRTGLFTVNIVLACIEKLCSIMNLVSVERDWVVIIAHGDEMARELLNARMRRVDLFCKLLGPLLITLVNGASTKAAIWLTLGMKCTSIFLEYVTIAQVFDMVPGLQRTTDPTNVSEFRAATSIPARFRGFNTIVIGWQSVASRIMPIKSLSYYHNHPAFLPSISLSLLYFTVLSFSGQMITFLLAVGYTSFYVAIASGISTVFELSATWIAPKVQQKIGSIRGGMWFLSW